MNKSILAAALFAATTGLAFAGGGNNGDGCHGNCAGQPGNATANAGAIGIGYGQGGNGGVGYGGAGGQGGQGGMGGAGGQGGSVAGSGNSHNTNANINANRNANNNRNTNQQAQGQQQAAIAAQGQKQSSHNDNRSSARNEGNNSAQNVTVQGDRYEAAHIPVATAYAAPLVAGTNTCMGSSTGGFQGQVVGLSIGTTWEDHGCTMRSNAATLFSLGQTPAAIALMCQDTAVAKAMATAGTPCPGSAKPGTPIALASTRAPTAAEKSAGYTGADPIVRRRLGLPPLK